MEKRKRKEKREKRKEKLSVQSQSNNDRIPGAASSKQDDYILDVMNGWTDGHLFLCARVEQETRTAEEC